MLRLRLRRGPYVEQLRGNHALSAALTGITAAVVGVIANLAVFFALHTLFGDTVSVSMGPATLEVPDLAVKPTAVAITILAAVLLFRLRWSVLRTLAVCAAVGVALGVTQGLRG